MNNLFKFNHPEKISEVEVVSTQLAILFLEDKDIPIQYKRRSKSSRKIKEDALIQVRFKKHVDNWSKTVSNILKNVDNEQAWRFINLKPQVTDNIKSVSEHKDFVDFTDYIVLRRDVQFCDDSELGCLAMLHTSFQKEIEKVLNINKPDFVSIDFEHATRFKGSVCSVGIASFKNGEIIDEYYSLVKPPQNEYEWATTNKHKINSTHTENAPGFNEVFPEISKRIKDKTVVAHGAFHTDKHCLEQAMGHNDIMDNLNINWVCTQELCESKLDVACKVCNIELEHHNSLSDAKACGVLYDLYLKNELPIGLIQEEKAIQKELQQSNSSFYPKALTGEVLKPDFENAKNKNNPFFMRKVVITGFDSAVKEQLAIELKELGADVDTNVGKRTNFLIIGDNAGPSKVKNMKMNIKEGKEASIITLEEFKAMKIQHSAK